MDYVLLWAVLGGIALLLLLILRLKLPAFLALLLQYKCRGICWNFYLRNFKHPSRRYGQYLRFCRHSGGTGTLLGGLLEHSGGAEALAQQLLKSFGEKLPTGHWLQQVLLAIPVFLMWLYSFSSPCLFIQRKTGKSILLYGCLY